MVDKRLFKRAVAELVGTYALVTAGCGAIIVNSQTGSLGHVGVALTFGLIILAMIAALGHISGAHFNPSVTIAFALTRHFPWRDVVWYVSVQMLGAVLGAITLRLLFGDIAHLGATMPAGSVWQSFGLEILLTAVLMLVIISVATDTRAVGTPAAVAIGFTVALDALWGGPVSGASMNPARSLAPALVAGLWNDQWIYVVAPVIGAGIGAGLYQFLRGENEA
jgi:aquaporin NIP